MNINNIRERLSKITSPPWKWNTVDMFLTSQAERKGRIIMNTEYDWKEDEHKISVSRADRIFIENAPTDIAFLLGEVERLTSERDEYRENALSLVKLTRKKPCFLCVYDHEPTDICIECRGQNNWEYRGSKAELQE